MSVNSAPRMVRATAMPTRETTSVPVSLSAAPIEVLFVGRPRSTLVSAQPGGHEHKRDRDPDLVNMEGPAHAVP
jgi:hypothetical protein